MPFPAGAESRSDLDASNASNGFGNSSQSGMGTGESSLPPFGQRNRRSGANAAEDSAHHQGNAKGRRKTFHGARAQDRRKNISCSIINTAESHASTINLLSPDPPVNPLPVLDSHVPLSSVLAPPHTLSFFGSSRNDGFALPSKGVEYIDSDDTLCNDVHANPLSGIDANQDSVHKSRNVLVASPMSNTKSIVAESFGGPKQANGELERAIKRRKLQDYVNTMKEMNFETSEVPNLRRPLMGNPSNPINVETVTENEGMGKASEGYYVMEPKMELISPRLGTEGPSRADVLSGPIDEHEITDVAPAIEQYISQHTEQWEERRAYWTDCDFDSWMAGGTMIMERFAKLFERVQESVESDLKAFQTVDTILQNHRLNVLAKRDDMLRQVKDTIVAGSSDILSTCSTSA